MTLKQIESILKAHSVPYYIENDHIYADSMIADTEIFEHTENVTDWTKNQLYIWLGY